MAFAALTASRNKLRRELRRRRAALSYAEREQAARQAVHRVSRLAWFRKARTVALYTPVGAEMNAAAVFDTRGPSNKQFYLPVLARGTRPLLLFAPWDKQTHWRRNRYGIAEPRVSAALLRRPTQLDLVIVPLVGFDAQCQRLGAGGGYYDRSFAYRRRRATWRPPRLVGLAFECQRQSELTTQAWDVPLDAVATEQRVYLR